MDRSTLRRLIVVGAIAGSLAAGTPALADSGKPKPVPPNCAPGIGRADPDRPDTAQSPTTGPGNRAHSFGEPPGPGDCTAL
jgi:hypothetical protein